MSCGACRRAWNKQTAPIFHEPRHSNPFLPKNQKFYVPRAGYLPSPPKCFRSLGPVALTRGPIRGSQRLSRTSPRIHNKCARILFGTGSGARKDLFGTVVARRFYAEIAIADVGGYAAFIGNNRWFSEWQIGFTSCLTDRFFRIFRRSGHQLTYNYIHRKRLNCTSALAANPL